MNKPLRQPLLSTTMKSLDALLREEKGAAGAGGGVSEKALDAMIRTVPRALRREVGECIQRLEVMLEVTGFPYITWSEALRSYRAARAPGGIPAAAGLLPSLVLAKARDLDLAFERIHKFDPADFQCEPVVTIALSNKQREVSALAVKKRSERTQVDRGERRALIEQAFDLLAAVKKVDAANLTDAEVLGQLDRFDTQLPTRNALKRDIDYVRGRLNKKSVSHPDD